MIEFDACINVYIRENDTSETHILKSSKKIPSPLYRIRQSIPRPKPNKTPSVTQIVPEGKILFTELR